MITPTVGRKVWYSPNPTRGEFRGKLGEQPFDATIVYVHNDRRVNLLITDHRGLQFTKEDVILLQDGDAPFPEGGHCYWMPYQKGQAAKTEEAQQQLSFFPIPTPIR